MAVTPTGKGYWLVGSDGTLHPHGDAETVGTSTGPPYANPIKGIVANPLGGYYLYTAHGNAYNSTDATWYGSNTTVTNIVGMAVTPTGKGYWLVGSDGTRYPHGDAETVGTASPPPYANPIKGIVANPLGGYYLYTAHGNVYNSTDATWYGSDTTQTNITGMAVTHTGKGYWLIGSDGTRHPHGDATTIGTSTGPPYAHPITGVAATTVTVTGTPTPTTTTGYDLDHRPKTVTDAAGNHTSTDYDLDGLTVHSTEANGNTTIYSYDPNGQRTQQQVPHVQNGATISYDTTQYTYDQAGNPTSVISPRGIASGITGAYTTRTSYDEDNRKKAVFGAYNPNDPVYNTAPETDYTYDFAGRLTQVTAPPSGGQTIRPVTTYEYLDNGWTKTSTDPYGITTSYEYNQLGEQTARTLTSAGGDASRTQQWSYYLDGTLQNVTDHGVPVGLNVELVDNSDRQNTSASPASSWLASTAAPGYYGYNYHTDATGSGSFTWNLTIPADGTYQVYVQYPAVTGAATTATYTLTHAGATDTKTIDQTTNTGKWVSLGSYSFTQAAAAKISLAANSSGTAVADAVKIVRDYSADPQPAPNSFTYSYDANGQTTGIADASPGALFDAYAYSYDQAGRLTQLQEKLSGTVRHTTGYGYNPNGQPTSMTHDAEQASYGYDVRNLLATVTNKLSSADTDPHTTSYTYKPGGQINTQTKGNGNVVTFGYNLDNTIATQTEKTSGGSLIASHTYTYDPNNNPIQDVSSVQNADNHAVMVTNTATDTYTPADQIASVTNSNGSRNQTYAYDLAGNITSQTIGGTTTTNFYNRNRLLTATTGGVTDNYNYDPFGRTDTITAADKVIARYAYDGFDNITSESKLTASGMATTSYAFDPLGRKTRQTLNAGTPSPATTNFDYLATSSALADETSNGTITKTYQYAPTGERLDQIVHNADGTLTPTYYTYNPHTDVQAITNADGTTKATYGYTAYGADDTSQDTGIDKTTGTGATSPTGTTQPYNPYRFNHDRIDPTTATVDTGFRTYDPSISRFLTRDMYNGALADQNLTTNPYTGNPYAFAAGNPLTNIELDGHRPICDGEECSSSVIKTWQKAQEQAVSSAQNCWGPGGEWQCGQRGTPPTIGISAPPDWPVEMYAAFGPAIRNAEQWMSDVMDAARRAGVDPALVFAIVMQETSGKELFLGPTGLAAENDLAWYLQQSGAFPKAGDLHTVLRTLRRARSSWSRLSTPLNSAT
jgi:RHS repeat-associated protein